MEWFSHDRRLVLVGVGSLMLLSRTGESIARVIDWSNGPSLIPLEVEGQGTDLGKLHNQVYQAFIASLETILSWQTIRIIGYKGFINRNHSGRYTLRYTVSYRAVVPGENPHRHIELISSVWRERGQGEAKARKRNQERTWAYDQKWQVGFRGSSIREHGSGDADLYQIGRLYLAEGRNQKGW